MFLWKLTASGVSHLSLFFFVIYVNFFFCVYCHQSNGLKCFYFVYMHDFLLQLCWKIPSYKILIFGYFCQCMSRIENYRFEIK